jgi:hypothetical protein
LADGAIILLGLEMRVSLPIAGLVRLSGTRLRAILALIVNAGLDWVEGLSKRLSTRFDFRLRRASSHAWLLVISASVELGKSPVPRQKVGDTLGVCCSIGTRLEQFWLSFANRFIFWQDFCF